MTIRVAQPDDLGLVTEPFDHDEICYLIYAMESWAARSDQRAQTLLRRLQKIKKQFEISEDDGRPTIDVKEGVVYLTRENRRVSVTSSYGRPFELFNGTNGITYHENGRALCDVGRDFPNDIVATTEPHTLDIACENG